MTRSEFLAPLIGQPWSWKGGNCWDFAGHVQRALFSIALPHIDVPDDPSWKWMVRTVSNHPEHANWEQKPEGPHGLVTASDGALCLMARFQGPGHVGVWLKPEGRVLHCDRQRGVCFETPLALKQIGWKQLLFYEPKSCTHL
ncbi:hypothetical protein V1291_000053 [Nitrobacteraceae bacterium AZCC 1564]